jgi:hypothetical protein
MMLQTRPLDAKRRRTPKRRAPSGQASGGCCPKNQPTDRRLPEVWKNQIRIERNRSAVRKMHLAARPASRVMQCLNAEIQATRAHPNAPRSAIAANHWPIPGALVASRPIPAQARRWSEKKPGAPDKMRRPPPTRAAREQVPPRHNKRRHERRKPAASQASRRQHHLEPVSPRAAALHANRQRNLDEY